MLNLVNWTLAASNVVDTNDGSISGYVTYNLDKPLSNDDIVIELQYKCILVLERLSQIQQPTAIPNVEPGDYALVIKKNPLAWLCRQCS